MSVFVLVDSDPEGWKEVKVPTNRFDPRHKTEIHEVLIEDVAGDSGSKEDIKELMVRLVESLHSHVKVLVNAFDVRKCLGSGDVHLNHRTRRSRDVLHARLPRRRRTSRAFRVAAREECSEWTHRMLLTWDVTVGEDRGENSNGFRGNASNELLMG